MRSFCLKKDKGMQYVLFLFSTITFVFTPFTYSQNLPAGKVKSKAKRNFEFKKEIVKIFPDLKDRNYKKRIDGVKSLGNIARTNPYAMDFLIKMLRDKNVEVRTWALCEMGSMNSKPTVIPNPLKYPVYRKAVKKAVPALINSFKRDNSLEVRASSIGTIGIFAQSGPVDKSVLPIIFSALRNNIACIRSAAAYAIGSFRPRFNPGCKKALIPLTNALQHDPSKNVRRNAAYSIYFVLKGYYSKSDEGNKKAIEKARKALLELLLKDQNVDVRERSASTLSFFHDEKTVQFLLKRLNSEKNYEVISSIIESLGTIGLEKDRVVPAIIKYYKFNQSLVRISVIFALSKFHPETKEMHALFKRALNDKDRGIRRVASRILVRYNSNNK